MSDINKSGVIVIQFDNIVINTDYERYLSLFCNKALLNRFCKNTKLISIENFNKRKAELFFVDIIKHMDKDRMEEAIVEIIKECYNIDYEACAPTTIMNNVLKNINYIESGSVKEVNILVSYPKENIGIFNAKKAFINKYITNKKIKVIPYETGSSIYECLEDKIPDWTLYITDNRYHLVEISEKYKSLKGKEIDFAVRGYNKYNPVTNILIKEKGGTITLFE